MSYDQPPGPAEQVGRNTTPSARPTSPPKGMPQWLLPALVAGATGLVIGIGGTLALQGILGSAIAGASGQDARLADAYSACGSPTGASLSDENRTLTVDVKGDEDSSGASYEEQACILNELDVPTRITSHLGQTTSVDGRQSESWDGITVEWSYHPNRGSDMVIMLDDVEG